MCVCVCVCVRERERERETLGFARIAEGAKSMIRRPLNDRALLSATYAAGARERGGGGWGGGGEGGREGGREFREREFRGREFRERERESLSGKILDSRGVQGES
jgi:hypothetical protein